MRSKKLEKMLVEKEMSKKELARKTNVTPIQVSRIISGRSKGSYKWWTNAAVVLGVNVNEIVGD